VAISIDAMFTGEPALALLIALALVARLAGAAGRSTAAAPLRLPGWLLCAVSAWLAGAAAGMFAPIGLALLIGLVLAFVDHFERRAPVWLIADAAVVAACGWVSIPAPTGATAGAIAVATALAGALVDRVVGVLAGARSAGRHSGERSVAPLRRAATAGLLLLPVLLWVGHGLAFPQARARFLRQQWPQIRPNLGPFVAVARADVGEAIELPGGAVGWLTLPPGPPPYRPALLFHGADEEGAYQRGALFLRRTLLGLGYAVLAVDAPGFGASDPPAALRDLDAWDPEPLSVAAANALLSQPGVEGSILAVGHSMGATRALRFLDVWVGASAAVVLGATVMPPASENQDLYDRFLDDFDLETSGLPPAFVLRVRERYFNNDRAAQRLPEGHAPVLFLLFSYEYRNIIAGRGRLYEMIAGRKVPWEVRTDHQFASSRVGGVLVGSWRVMGALKTGLGRFVDGRSPRDGRPLPFTPRR
jgi:pimeloyl-ACP methyl ester carboxylesterase